MQIFPTKLAAGLAAASLAFALASCSSCEVPKEPVLPSDISGSWSGAYTLYDGTGRSLTDSLHLDVESDRGEVTGEGVRKRYLPDTEPMQSDIRIEGSVVINTFRLELVDPASGNRAVFSGKVEGDTLSGRLSVDGEVMGELSLVGHDDRH